MNYMAYKKLTSWIALFAILLVSFAPVISHAKSLHDLLGSEKICTVHGMKEIPSGPVPVNNDHMVHLQHCSYCSLASDKAYLPASNLQLGLMVIPSYSKFFIEYESPVLQAHFQSSHPPQAPPVV